MEEFKNYCKRIEKENSEYLKVINREILDIDSYNRGKLLYEFLEQGNLNKSLKYYIFADWWTVIDGYIEKFTPDKVKQWLNDADIKFDFSGLNLDNDGFLTVYRGENENSKHNGMSWTTSKEVAVKFAKGVRIRRSAEKPSLLTGKVHYKDIVGMFDNRNEHEILCYKVQITDSTKIESDKDEFIRKHYKTCPKCGGKATNMYSDNAGGVEYGKFACLNCEWEEKK